MTLIHLLKSESIKRKGSALNWLIFGGSFFIPFVILLSRLLKHQQTVMQNSTEGIWMKLFYQNWQFMAILLLPMGIALAASLLNQTEFRNNAWKQLMVMPVSASAIFISKYLTMLYVLLQYFILFTIGIYLSGLIPALVYSDVVYPTEPFPFGDYLQKSSTYFIDCLPIVAIQFLLSLHLRNYIISIGAGFILLIGSLIGMNWSAGYILPYSYAALDFLKADNKINAEVNLQKWAMAYFIVLSTFNYILFLYKSHLSVSLIKKGYCKNELMYIISAVVVSGLSIVLLKQAGYSFSHSNGIKDDTKNKRIERVENNSGAFIFSNNTEWSIEARMKHYKVSGLSIAIINNYNIDWAKAYGYADMAKKP